MNDTTIATAPTNSLISAAEVFGLGSFASSFLSIPGITDWLRIAVLGAVYETCRQLDILSFSNLYERFWLTAIFTEEDISYAWIMYWLSKQPSWNDSRKVEVYTREFSALVWGSSREEDDGRNVTYIPSVQATYHFWYKGRLMSVYREVVSNGFRATTERINIRILTRSKHILEDLIEEAREIYLESRKDMISIHVCDQYDNWSEAGTRPKRPMQSVILEPGLRELLMNDAHDFLDSKDWYTERGIPFRRGYLLYGAPGSGKTSMIQAIAGELGLDVYIISLSRAGMDDTVLSKVISNMPSRCIALMEDIDAAFSHIVRRDNVDTGRPTQDKAEAKETSSDDKAANDGLEKSRSSVTLSGLLNALDGIGAQEGRILFATTNRYDALDAALCRPGRMDLHVEFKLASKYQAEGLFKAFYKPSPLKAKSNAKHLKNPGKEDEKAGDSRSYKGELSSVRAPVLSLDEVQTLAAKFSDAIPEGELSMASLQGYLMAYKIRPREAVEDAATWVEEQLRNRSRH